MVLIKFTVMGEYGNSDKIHREKRVLAEDLVAPVLPRVGEWVYITGEDGEPDGYPVEGVDYEFNKDKGLACILVTVYAGSKVP